MDHSGRPCSLMVEVVANDPSLVLVAVAAVGLAVLLKRLASPLRRIRSEQQQQEAVERYGLAVLRELRLVDLDTIDLDAVTAIDIREHVDLTDAPSHDMDLSAPPLADNAEQPPKL